MRGYTFLARPVYTIIYAATAGLLCINFLATLVGLWSFGEVFWWPAFLLVFIVLVLEIESAYSRLTT